MSVHVELKKAIDRIAQLEQEVRFHESVVTITKDEKQRLADRIEDLREQRRELKDLNLGLKHRLNAAEETAIGLTGQIDALKARLQIDPGGGDLIDAHEATIEHLRFQVEHLQRGVSTEQAKFRIANKQTRAAQEQYIALRAAGHKDETLRADTAERRLRQLVNYLGNMVEGWRYTHPSTAKELRNLLKSVEAEAWWIS